MAELVFHHGTMACGKSARALQIHHTLASQGWAGLLLSAGDRRDAAITSRLGIAADATAVRPDTDLGALLRAQGLLRYVVVDEAQFLTEAQVEALAAVADDDDVDVFAFGLLTDFRSHLFPGSRRLVELADRLVEIHVEARCHCGRRATQNARVVDGKVVDEGAQRVLGDVGQDQPVGYVLLCRRHWRERDAGLAVSAGASTF